VSACFCVVVSCVSIEALCWTDPPTKESYQMSVDREIRSGRSRSDKDCRSQWKKNIYIYGINDRSLYNGKVGFMSSADTL
jgi:hypothetical protein